MEDFWDELLWRLPVTAVTAALAGAVSFFVTLWLRYHFQRWLRKRLRRDAAEYARKHGQAEAALVLSVLTDIGASARSYLERAGRQGIQVFACHQPEGFGEGEEQWDDYLDRVKAEVRKVRELGAQRVYLFANIPLALAFAVGAVLANGPEVVLHHFQDGVYRPVGRLTIDTVRL